MAGTVSVWIEGEADTLVEQRISKVARVYIRQVAGETSKSSHIPSGTTFLAYCCNSEFTQGKTEKATGRRNKLRRGNNQNQRDGPKTKGTAKTKLPHAFLESVRIKELIRATEYTKTKIRFL